MLVNATPFSDETLHPLQTTDTFTRKLQLLLFFSHFAGLNLARLMLARGPQVSQHRFKPGGGKVSVRGP